ncbi:MAG: hypothetical protein EOO40_12540, partial [Deltaproteobacteria bacterium]
IDSLQATKKDLIRAREQAEHGARLKAEFLANMSHEIRTPLNGVIGMTELLLETELSTDQQRFARTVQDSGTGLLHIINDILDFSKLEAGRFEIERIDFSVTNTVEDQVSLLSRRAADRALTILTFIDPRIPARLVGDPGRIGQVLLNLVGNAIKFSRAGTIMVRVDPQEPMHDPLHLRFSIKDQGIGIAPEVQQRLFTPFTQADGSTARRFGGTGLGLSICKRLVEMMGGTIGIDSKLGDGATFWFTLPCPRATGAAAIQHHTAAWGHLHVLILSPNAEASDIVALYLQSWGAKATCIRTVAELATTLAGSQLPYLLEVWKRWTSVVEQEQVVLLAARQGCR